MKKLIASLALWLLAFFSGAAHAQVLANGCTVTGAYHIAEGKKLTLNHATPLTLLNLTSSHGEIDWIQLIMQSGNPDNISNQLTITRDGESTPSINGIAAQDFFSARGFASPAARKASDVLSLYTSGSASGNNQYSWYVTIPFTQSIQIVLADPNVALGNTTVWYSVGYHLNSLNWGNYEHLNAVRTSASVAAYASQDIVNISGAGALYGIYLNSAGGDGNYNYLEGSPQCFIDGEGSPSVISSGNEDFFHGSFYWDGLSSGSSLLTENYGVTRFDASATVGEYRFFRQDPVPFTSSLHCQFVNGNATYASVTNATTLNAVVWYYLNQ